MSKKTSLRLKDYDINGRKVKKTKKVEILENTTLEKIVLSKIRLQPEESTKQETLNGEERIFFFLDGHAEVTMNSQVFTVQPKDVILIPRGSTYQIKNYNDHTVLECNVVSTQLS